jgi:DNA-binding transcriptional ArsR family regulator
LPQKTKARVDLRMAKALSHPIRVQILTILHKRVASPNQIAQEIGEGLSQVSYHFKVLREFECIELVKTEPRRGAVEHFYRATAAPYHSDSEFEALPPRLRQGLSVVTMQMIVRDAMEAIEAGTFDSRGNRHLSRSPLTVDEQGWEDLTSLLADTLDRVLEVQVESSSRLARSEEKPIHAKVDLLQFESPEPEPSKGRSKAKS